MKILVHPLWDQQRHAVALITYAKEVMFSPLFVCLTVSNFADELHHNRQHSTSIHVFA